MCNTCDRKGYMTIPTYTDPSAIHLMKNLPDYCKCEICSAARASNMIQCCLTVWRASAWAEQAKKEIAEKYPDITI